MKVLVVGGFGFLGSHIIGAMLDRGYSVTSVGRSLKVRHSSSVSTIEWDASSPWKASLPDCDIVVHLASANGSGDLNSLSTYGNNIAVTKNVIDLCRSIPECALMYVSTIQVLGSPVGAIDESTPARPITDYGFAHWVAEEHARLFARTHGRRVVVVRPSNIIGVGEVPDSIRWNLVPADFCRQVVMRNQIQLRSTGEERRDFLSVQDFGHRIATILRHRDQWRGQAILIGSGHTTSIFQMATLVAHQFRFLRGATLNSEVVKGEKVSENSGEFQMKSNTHFGESFVGPGKISDAESINRLLLAAEVRFR